MRTLEGAIVKRLAAGRPDGVAVIAEGIAEYLDENDPILRDAPRDEHGHVRLAEVPIARVLRTAVADSLARRGVKVTIGEKDVGYELRCGYPTAFDRDYTRDLGVGAVKTLEAGGSSVLITRQEAASGRSRSRRSSIRRPDARACAASTSSRIRIAMRWRSRSAIFQADLDDARTAGRDRRRREALARGRQAALRTVVNDGRGAARSPRGRRTPGSGGIPGGFRRSSGACRRCRRRRCACSA